MHDERSHAHAHGHAHGGSQRRLAITLALAAAYMVAEVVGGLLANSLALLADAGHMLSDVGALALSLFALWFARRPATPRRTFGYYRAEVLAALANGAALGAIAVLVVVRAIGRFGEAYEVEGPLMLAVAAGGLAVNVAGLLILRKGRGENLNVLGAWLHVLMDTLGSVGAMTAGLLIWLFGWDWIDPAMSIAISVLIAFSGWHLVREALSVLMESTPRGIDVDAVRTALLEIEGAESVHDLHVWTLTQGMDSLSAHVVARANCPYRDLLEAARRVLHDRFGIEHVTIQIDPPGFAEHGTQHA